MPTLTRRPIAGHLVEVKQGVTWDIVEDGTSGTTALQADQQHVWIEWIGQPRPFESPTVRYAMMTDMITREQKAAIRMMGVRCIRRVNGVTTRTLNTGNGPGEIPKLSRNITWGPKNRAKPGEEGSYIHKVTHREAEAIKAAPAGEEFRILGLAEQDPDPTNIALMLMLPITNVQLGSPEVFKTFKAFEEKMGW